MRSFLLFAAMLDYRRISFCFKLCFDPRAKAWRLLRAWRTAPLTSSRRRWDVLRKPWRSGAPPCLTTPKHVKAMYIYIYMDIRTHTYIIFISLHYFVQDDFSWKVAVPCSFDVFLNLALSSFVDRFTIHWQSWGKTEEIWPNFQEQISNMQTWM